MSTVHPQAAAKALIAQALAASGAGGAAEESGDTGAAEAEAQFKEDAGSKSGGGDNLKRR